MDKQRGSTSQMIFPVNQLISFVSGCMTLEAGDIILTGTPSGVGPIRSGQSVSCGITGVVDMTFPIIDEAPKSAL